MERFDLVPLLDYIDPDYSYERWCQVGMALKHEGYSMAVWDDWSRRGAKYQEGECLKKWTTFEENTETIVTGATVTQFAKEGGWKKSPPRISGKREPFILTEEDFDGPPICVESTEFKIPGEEWKPYEDVINYLTALFKPDEYVGLVLNSYQEKDGKYRPIEDGNEKRTAGQLIKLLQQRKRVNMVLGSLQNEAAGGWIRFNPLDGQGAKNSNVTDYRFALVESDNMPLGKQLALIKHMELPCGAVVYSGGKSVHAIVHIDANTRKEYQERVQKLYDICNKNGFKVDTQNKNPSRMSRLPGVTRNGVKQFLVGTNMGKKSWEEWIAWLDEQNDDLPPFDNLETVLKDPPPLSPALIEGALRMGHKGMLTGPSKAGKSFLLMELAIAVSSGRRWLVWECHKGKVLYVNLEIDAPSCINRFQQIYDALGDSTISDWKENIDIWNLRGKAIPMDKLAPIIVRRAKGQGYALVIIDPIYKVITGDENSASDMAYFGNQFDLICTEVGCALMYCHHHSKGAQGMKKAADRGSGSGVFARDVDLMVDATALVLPEGDANENPAYCISTIAREFPATPDFAIRFVHPIHKIDETLDPSRTEGSIEGNRTAGNNAQTKKKDERYWSFIELLETHLKAGDRVTQSQMAEQLGVNTMTVRRYLQRANDPSRIYAVENGRGGCIKWAETMLVNPNKNPNNSI